MAATTVNSFVQGNGTTNSEVSREYPKKLVIRSQNRIFLQTVSEIDYLTAAANYVHIHAGAQVSRIRSTINSIEERLDPQKFGRIHRCTIVNLERVTEFRPLQRGDYMLILQDGTELKMSRRHRVQLEKLVGSGGLAGRHVVKYAGANNQQSRPPAANSRSGRAPSIS
ncbi:MAG: LytTR family transcriptional regulator [Acidobacteria bacterium]|nr:LytTR family transcriptional regulator [Acidobacteriota bacterium]